MNGQPSKFAVQQAKENARRKSLYIFNFQILVKEKTFTNHTYCKYSVNSIDRT